MYLATTPHIVRYTELFVLKIPNHLTQEVGLCVNSVSKQLCPQTEREGNQRKCSASHGQIILILCGNKMPTRCNRWFLLQILLLAQHVSGNIMPIIRSSRVLCKWLLPVVYGAWFSRCRYGVELRVVCPVCGLLPSNRTHNPLVGILFPHIYHKSFLVCKLWSIFM